MSDATAGQIETEDAAPRKGGAKGLILVAALALASGGGAFYATWSGLLGGLIGGGSAAEAHGAESSVDAAEAPADGPAPDGAARQAGPGATFVTLPPLSVAIGSGGADRQLRVQAVLDVDPAREAEVAALAPRVQDSVLGYLRALDPAILADPAALLRIRSQMLRRARMIAGDEAVHDLLVTDFVLN